jgi:hypothetical protein
MRIRTLALAGGLCALVGGTAHASCGSAFCVLNTNWSTQGVPSAAGTARLDLHYEYVNMDKLYQGSKKISQDQDTEDTIEQRTINRNLVATLDYAFSNNWSATVSVPWVDRSHSHIADATTDTPTQETWNFTELADSRVLANYRFDNPDPTKSYGITFGLKLPTGSYKVTNADGVAAERMLQPGTGTTDGIIGAYYSAPGFSHDASWWAQIMYQHALDSADQYKPGDQTTINVGYRYPFTDKFMGMLQLNTLIKGRETGANAEPDVSGSKTVYFSPGLGYQVTPDVQIYSFLQLPIYRYVNGIQLTADWAAVVGATVRF